MRVADYIVKELEKHGVEHIFMITGGGAMFLNDAVGLSSKIKYVCCHHEQALAIAAEGYARVKGSLAVVVVTSGPGGTNAITGVGGQWLDSIPTLYISGQVKHETTIHSDPGLGLRQLGDQELNVIDLVKPITKYATMVTDPLKIGIELKRAMELAESGRPGPVWLDIPLNVQGANIEEDALHTERPMLVSRKTAPTTAEVGHFYDLLMKAERPVFVAGHGIRLAKAERQFRSFIERHNIPVVTTFNGFDLLPSAHPLFIGRIGTIGTRPGNFAYQNADLIISVGSRNNIRQVSYNWALTARAATKIVVDIDEPELRKKTFIPHLGIVADARVFLEKILDRIESIPKSDKWVAWCQQRKERFPIVLPEYLQTTRVHPYPLVESLTRKMSEGDVVVAGNGSACVVLFQAGIVKEQQRMFWNSGMASMGYDLPAAIGAHYATGRSVYCFAGDGSIMMNIQEFQTVAAQKLPIKIILLNNDGYSSIRQTQNSFFNGHLVGCNPESGVTFPDFGRLAQAFGIPTMKISSMANLDRQLDEVVNHQGALLCEVVLDTQYQFSPKLSSEKKPDGTMVSKPLEDLYPFLDRAEFRSHMLIKTLE